MHPLNDTRTLLQSEKYWDSLTCVPIQPTKIKDDFALEFSQFYQQVISQAASMVEAWEAGAGLKHTCSTGCQHCCFQLIEIYDFELIAILAYIKEKKLEHLLDDGIDVADFIEQKLPNASLGSTATLEDELLKHKMQYRTFSIPCIFLKDNKCQIYPVRPSSCANYYSYGETQNCAQKEQLSTYCKSFGPVEDWIVKQVISYLDYNRSYLPRYFDPFNLRFLPIAIRDSLIDLFDEE